ncbi:MAG: hypothetical protein ACLSHG_00080 [Oscillospiraceae bacterium]
MAETNTAALRAQGERDARALTVTGRRRADTGRIRRAGSARAHGARRHARDAERPVAARTTGALPAPRRAMPWPLWHARVRTSGGQTALGACCAGCCARAGGADGQGGGGVSGRVSGRAAARDGGACPARAGAAGGRGVRAGGHLRP